MNIFLFGAPGSGKTTVGLLLAERLGWQYVDTDQRIENETGMPITEVFIHEGEAGFRAREKQLLKTISRATRQIISLGGGTLVDPENRSLAEASGPVVCFSCDPETILERMGDALIARPLLAGPGPLERLKSLLEKRSSLYGSFPLKLDTTRISPEEAAERIQILTGAYALKAMGGGYEVLIHRGLLATISEELEARKLRGPIAVITDSNVEKYYLAQVLESLSKKEKPVSIIIPAGEENKSLRTAEMLYGKLFEAGMDRRGTIIALGGGMVTDIAGFAAATFMRGVSWVAMPTTLLSMVDAAVGGKTAVDLPEGKNLVGAFHPPSMVLADLDTLATLPERELRSGMAEVVKSAIVGDSKLMTLLENLNGSIETGKLDEIIRRAVRVKIRVVEEDPVERHGKREALNFGHTIGHAIESQSKFVLHHGEAIALGMVAESALAEQLNIAEQGLTARVTSLVNSFSLPIKRALPVEEIMSRIKGDKKRVAGRIRWALPAKPGKVRVGLDAAEEEVRKALSVLE